MVVLFLYLVARKDEPHEMLVSALKQGRLLVERTAGKPTQRTSSWSSSCRLMVEDEDRDEARLILLWASMRIIGCVPLLNDLCNAGGDTKQQATIHSNANIILIFVYF